jgi:predicted nucleic-acid-binding protein
MALPTGLDTNVALRWLVGAPDDAVQAQRAGSAIAGVKGSLYLNTVVLAEIVWVMAHSMKLDRAAQALAIRTLLDNPLVQLPQRDVVSSALVAFESGGAGFTDHLIAALNRAAGCATTLTFDKIAAKSPDFTLLA